MDSPNGANPYLRAIDALNLSRNRYVLVGGFSVVMHGSNRFTPDLNVVVDFRQPGISMTVQALLDQDLAPESFEQAHGFAKPDQRQMLKEGKKVWFLSFRDPQVPTFSVDLLLDHPHEFDSLYEEADVITFAGTETRICSVPHLITMKSKADRGQDRVDVENLRVVQHLLARLEAGESQQQILDSTEEGFERDRCGQILDFLDMSHDERMDWLLHMLMHLGKFCLV